MVMPFVVIHTRLVALGLQKRASIRCVFGFPNLGLLIRLSVFQVPKVVSLCSGSRPLFVRC